MPLEYSKQFSQSDLKNLIFKHFPDATRYQKQLTYPSTDFDLIFVVKSGTDRG